MKKIKIHIIDDQQSWRNDIKLAFTPNVPNDKLEEFIKHNSLKINPAKGTKKAMEKISFTESFFDITEFENVNSAKECYSKKENIPDILLLDIDFSNLDPDQYSIEERSYTRGLDLFDYIKKDTFFKGTIIRLVTGQSKYKNEEVDGEISAKLYANNIDNSHIIQKNQTITSIQLIKNNWLCAIAKKKLKLATSLVKKKLKELILSNNWEKDSEFKIEIQNDEYRFCDLFFGWYDETKEKLKNDILAELTPDLSLAASECFGINGIKQATHDLEQQYYIGDNGWISNMKKQLDDYYKILIEVKSEFDGENLKEIKSNYEKYLKKINVIKDEVQKISQKKEAEKFFENNKSKYRFGTSPNSTKIEINNKPLEKINKGNEFEIYFPVHELYSNQFEKLLSKSKDFKAYSFNTEKKLEDNPTWKVHEQPEFDKTPKLFKEYIIFTQEFENGNENEYSENIPLESQPDFLSNFINLKFEYFGNIYVILKQNGNWILYNCTYIDNILHEIIDFNQFETYMIESKDLLKKLTTNENAKAYFIFEFLTWRQP